MSSDQSDWMRVARAVIKRREDLGMTQSEVAHEGGVSLDRVSAIERARTMTYRGGTLRAIERALRWERDSITAILAGGEPMPAEVISSQDLAPTDVAQLLRQFGHIPEIREVIDKVASGGPSVAAGTQRLRQARTAALHRELNEEREKLRALTEEIADDDVRTAVRMLEALADREAG